MMYASYPELTPAQRLALLPPLDLARCCVPLDSAARAARLNRVLREARVAMILDRPVYRLRDDSDRRALVYADSGTLLDTLPLSLAAGLASRVIGSPRDEGTVLGRPDQWILEEARSDLPVVRFAIRDAAATRIYVSLVSGEIIQMVSRRQRALAWMGAIPHWIYPALLRRHRDVWRHIVLALAAFGALTALLGIILGVWRIRLRYRDQWLRSPFVDPWMRWHHYLGLAFGVFAFTWVFSGLLSLDPFEWSPGGAPSRAEAGAMAGGPLDLDSVALSPREAWEHMRGAISARALELTRIGGKVFYVGAESPSATRLLPADQLGALPRARLDRDDLLFAFRSVARGAPIVSVTELSTYDDYYYAHTSDRTLPVLRIVLGDGEASWYYLDVRTGTIALKTTRRSRAERWLYHGLHSLDFKMLMSHAPLWDVVVILLCLGGLTLSGTGSVLAVRWLDSRRHARHARGR